MTRDDALALVHEYTASDALRKHMYAVEIGMRAYARHYGADEETWGLVGLLHDFDYERYPNDAHSPTEEHPSWGVRLLRERGLGEESCEAILGHAAYTGVPRRTLLARTLFAVDELCGFLVACALVRPQRLEGLEPKSVRKKLKTPSFAAAVSRADIDQGPELVGLPLDEHIQHCVAALQAAAGPLGLGGGGE